MVAPKIAENGAEGRRRSGRGHGFAAHGPGPEVLPPAFMASGGHLRRRRGGPRHASIGARLPSVAGRTGRKGYNCAATHFMGSPVRRPNVPNPLARALRCRAPILSLGRMAVVARRDLQSVPAVRIEVLLRSGMWRPAVRAVALPGVQPRLGRALRRVGSARRPVGAQRDSQPLHRWRRNQRAVRWSGSRTDDTV